MSLIAAALVAGFASVTIALSALVLRAERRSARIRERIQLYVGHHS